MAALKPFIRELAQLLVDEVRDILATANSSKIDVLTPPQVAKEIGKSNTTVRRWCKTGLIGKKVSRPGASRDQYLIHRDQLNEFLKSGEPVKTKARRSRRKKDPDVIEFF